MAPAKDSALAETKSVLSAVLLADSFNEVTGYTPPSLIKLQAAWLCNATVRHAQMTNEAVSLCVLAHMCRGCMIKRLVHATEVLYTSVHVDN